MLTKKLIKTATLANVYKEVKMKKIVNLSLMLFVTIVFLYGCASIVSKSEYPVSISSQPEGAKIIITNKAGQDIFLGKTPTTVTLKASRGFFKGEDYTVSFQKEGYTPHTAQIARRIDGWYIGNVVFGGLIGWLIVDPATGAMWTLKDLHVDLSPSETSLIEEKLEIITIDDVPDHLRSNMVRIN